MRRSHAKSDFKKVRPNPLIHNHHHLASKRSPGTCSAEHSRCGFQLISLTRAVPSHPDSKPSTPVQDIVNPSTRSLSHFLAWTAPVFHAVHTLKEIRLLISSVPRTEPALAAPARRCLPLHLTLFLYPLGIKDVAVLDMTVRWISVEVQY